MEPNKDMTLHNDFGKVFIDQNAEYIKVQDI